MDTLQDIKRAIMRLSHRNMQDLSLWMSTLAEQGYDVREPAVAYGVEPDLPYMSVEDYLEFELSQTLRHEYVNGVVYAMSGASERHNTITANVLAALHSHVRGGPCRAYVNDFKLRIKTERDEIFYYPDVMVACTREGVEKHWLHHPKVIVEVLSPSTEQIDRREKRLNCTKLSTLEEYVLIAQDRHELIVHRRENEWVPQSVADPTAQMELRSLAFAMPLAEIYEGLQL